MSLAQPRYLHSLTKVFTMKLPIMLCIRRVILLILGLMLIVEVFNQV